MKYTAGGSDDGKGRYNDGIVGELGAEPSEEDDGPHWPKEMYTRGGSITCYWSLLIDVVVRSVDEDV